MIADLLSIMAAGVVILSVLWVRQTDTAKSKFQFRLADVVSLAFLLQIEVALIAASKLLDEFERRGGRVSVLVTLLTFGVLLYWLLSVRELNRFGMKAGWRRIVFTNLLLPSTVAVASFASYAVQLAYYSQKGFGHQFLATMWPYSYQNLGVGYPPFERQLAYVIGGCLLLVVGTLILRLAHRRLLLIS